MWYYYIDPVDKGDGLNFLIKSICIGKAESNQSLCTEEGSLPTWIIQECSRSLLKRGHPVKRDDQRVKRAILLGIFVIHLDKTTI